MAEPCHAPPDALQDTSGIDTVHRRLALIDELVASGLSLQDAVTAALRGLAFEHSGAPGIGPEARERLTDVRRLISATRRYLADEGAIGSLALRGRCPPPAEMVRVVDEARSQRLAAHRAHLVALEAEESDLAHWLESAGFGGARGTTQLWKRALLDHLVSGRGLTTERAADVISAAIEASGFGGNADRVASAAALAKTRQR